MKDSRETVFVIICRGTHIREDEDEHDEGRIEGIDDLLSQLGEYGEVHLVIQHGELRYINRVESFKAWKNEDES